MSAITIRGFLAAGGSVAALSTMTGTVAAVIVVLALGAPAVGATPVLAQSETTPQAEVERWWSEATRFLDLDQTSEALSAMNNIVVLQEVHPDLELPPQFWVAHAAVAQEEGLPDVAVSSAQRYVNQKGANAAEHYAFAIRLLIQADLEAARQKYPDMEIYTVTVGGQPVGGLERPVRKNRHSYSPRRTAEADAARAYGAVVVGYIVNERGKVVDPVVLQDPGYGLAAEVLKAVKRYKFRPARLHGEPVAVYSFVTINFGPLPHSGTLPPNTRRSADPWPRP